MTTIFAQLRQEYHRTLCDRVLGLRSIDGPINISDKSSKASVDLAEGIAERIAMPRNVISKTGQAIGAEFESATCAYLEAAFAHLRHIRPGSWEFSTRTGAAGISQFEQYEHLAEIQTVLASHPQLKTAIGGDYIITPDIVVLRTPISDNHMNSTESLVDSQIASRSPLRQSNRSKATRVLHASISCKWTMRSDRVQNTRTEALNLIRNRKGATPKIAVVSIEPLPARLAAIAIGTGDVDCTYHVALDELLSAARNSTHSDACDLLEMLVAGRRLRDIADLPLDLAI